MVFTAIKKISYGEKKHGFRHNLEISGALNITKIVYANEQAVKLLHYLKRSQAIPLASENDIKNSKTTFYIPFENI